LCRWVKLLQWGLAVVLISGKKTWFPSTSFSENSGAKQKPAIGSNSKQNKKEIELKKVRSKGLRQNQPVFIPIVKEKKGRGRGGEDNPREWNNMLH